jgi:hypothetical protein
MPISYGRRHDDGLLQLICPTEAGQDVSDVFRQIAHASDRQATLHGVVFDIFDASSAPALD